MGGIIAAGFFPLSRCGFPPRNPGPLAWRLPKEGFRELPPLLDVCLEGLVVGLCCFVMFFSVSMVFNNLLVLLSVKYFPNMICFYIPFINIGEAFGGYT